MQLSIIIVNFNTCSLLKNCLESVFLHTKDLEFEVIVSDNGSSDGSVQMIKDFFPDVILLENKKNLGFGAANNKALSVAKGKYVFYLNSDTVLLNNACKFFYDFWENYKEKNNLGALGANLLNEKKEVIHSYGTFADYPLSIKQLVKMFFSNTALSIFYIFHLSPAKFRPSQKCSFYTGEVDYITGADLFLLNNKDALFDENFFLYFEEADLQKRLVPKKRLIINGPEIVHLCGASVGENFSIKRKASFSRIQFELSRVKFLKKYGKSFIKLFAVKFLITCCWLNPFLIKSTKKYLIPLWKI